MSNPQGSWPSPDVSRPSGPLGGVRILDLSAMGPGPFGTMLLAAFGADVIHVGRAGKGDPAADASHQNSGKRSILLDLKAEEGRQIVRQLAQDADIMIEGFRPGVMERLGLGPDEMLAANPRLLYARITGWGQTGPYAKMTGHDINYIAISGALSLIGRDEPTPPLALVGDYASGGMMMVITLLSALRQRDADGVGQVLDCAIVDGAAMLLHGALATAAKGRRPTSVELLNGSAPFYRAYRCGDGKWFSVGAIEAKFYANLIRTIGLADEPIMARQYDMNAWPAMSERMAAKFAERSRAEWAELLMDAEACAFPVIELGELADEPHLAARGVAYREDGQTRTARAGRVMGEAAVRIAAAPAPGHDTVAVLAALGHSPEQIVAMLAAGAAAAQPG